MITSRKFLPVFAAVLMGLSFSPGVRAQSDMDTPVDEVPAAVSLDTPSLPNLDKGEWKAEKTIFDDALYVTDAQDNAIGNPVNLPGMQYTAHFEYQRQPDALEEDLLDRTASNYQKALSDRGFDYQITVPDSSWQIAGVITDSSDGGVSGQLAIVGGNLRFIAVRTTESGGGEAEDASPPPASANIPVSGDIQIFISDIVPVADLLKKIKAQEKSGTPVVP